MRWCGLAVILTVSGCFDSGDRSPAPSWQVPSDLRACVPDDEVYFSCRRAYSDASESLASIAVTVGDINDVAKGLQQVLVGRALLESGLTDTEKVSLSFEFPRAAAVSAAARPDGTFVRGMSRTSSFSVRVWKPGGDEPIADDVLSFDSYFEGARLVSTLDVSMVDVNKTLSFTLSWDARGPLADVIDPDGKLTSPIEFESSLEELRGFEPIANLEPFDALLDLEADWSAESDPSVPVNAELGAYKTQLRYQATGARLGLRERARDPVEAIDFSVIEGQLGGLSLSASPEIEYLGADELQGTVRYDLSSGDTKLSVEDRYTGAVKGSSAAGIPSESRWACR